MTISSYKVTGLLTWNEVTDTAKFRYRLRRAMRNATIKNGKLALARVRKRIAAGNFTQNSNLTILIKGSSSPLTDTRKMRMALRSSEFSVGTVFVGVPQSDPSYLPCVVVHEGASVTVTPAMRAMFMLLYQASQGTLTQSLTGRAEEIWRRSGHSEEFYPISAGTKYIVIPPRPFIRETFEDPSFIMQCKSNWIIAFQRGCAPLIRRGKDK